MANKKLSFTEISLLIFLLVLWGLIVGCSSAPKAYYCPNKHSIPMENIKIDIRAINTCSTCGAQFPYMETKGKRSGGYYFGYTPYYPGYRVWVYRYGTTRFHSYRGSHHGH